MNKSITLLIAIIIGFNIFSMPINARITKYINSENIEEWTGLIRIEGKNNTIWNEYVTIKDVTISIINVDTGLIEEHYIPYPTVLGALDKAAGNGNFSYSVEYWPSYDAYLVTSIGNDSDWWHYWIDYKLPMTDVSSYKLKEYDNEILIGYLESWFAHALIINVEKTELKKNEEFKIIVFNESMDPIKDAIVYIDSKQFITDINGELVVKISKKGNYEIYAEKKDSVRSEKIYINVKKSINVLIYYLNSITGRFTDKINEIYHYFFRLCTLNNYIFV